MDDVFSADLADELLDFAVAHEADFQRATIGSLDPKVDLDYRTSLECQAHFGTLGERLETALLQILPDLCEKTGMRPFASPQPELSLVAFGNGQFYKTHIDSATGNRILDETSVRVLTAVIYVHRLPRAFTGGEIVIKPVGGETHRVIEPRHNRLVAFPAMTPHEVLPTHMTDTAFANSRFSLNCWFHRRRK